MNVTQGVFKNTSIYGMTFIDKYSGIKSIITSEGYTSKFLDKANTNTSQTSTVLSDDNTYYNIVEDCSLNNCNIETGRFINCFITGNVDGSNYIKNGYFSGCTFYNYIIDDGKFIDCSIDNTNVFNNGFWDNENSDFEWTKPWTSGVWNSGTFNNPYGWYGGTFNGGTFENSFWSGGTVNGGTFIGIIFSDGLVRSADFIDGCVFEDGVFNNGTFTDSSFNGGYFNGGTMKNSNISGTSVKSVINGGIIFDCNIDGDVDINGGHIENDSIIYSINNANVYNGNFSNLNVVGGNFYNGKYKNINFYGGDIYNGFYSNITSSIFGMLSENYNMLIMENGSTALFEKNSNHLSFGLTIHNGTFRNSFFKDTNIKNGNFTNCDSKDSLFEYGVYTDGNMLDCGWNDGYWNDGSFITTVVNSGVSNSLSIIVNSALIPTTTTTTTASSITTTTTSSSTTTTSSSTTTTTTIAPFTINSVVNRITEPGYVDVSFSGVPIGTNQIIIWCSSGDVFIYNSGLPVIFSTPEMAYNSSPIQFYISTQPKGILKFKLEADIPGTFVYSNIYEYDNSAPATTTTTTTTSPIQHVTYSGPGNPTQTSSLSSCSLDAKIRPYYTNSSGVIKDNIVYNDYNLTMPCSGYAGKFLGLSKDSSKVWCQLDANGKILVAGNC